MLRNHRMLSGIMVDYALLTNPSSAKLTGSGSLFFLEKRHINIILSIYSAPVAQLVEHRAVTWEVVSSNPARPTLRVLK